MEKTTIEYIGTFKELFTHSKEAKISKGGRHYFVALRGSDKTNHCVWKSKRLQESNSSLNKNDFKDHVIALLDGERYVLCYNSSDELSIDIIDDDLPF